MDTVPDAWAKVSEKYQWEPEQENLTKAEILQVTSSLAARMLLDKNWKGKSALFSTVAGEKSHTCLMIADIITVTWGSTE